MDEPKRSQRIAALLTERTGYERSGKSERAEMVNVELRKLGYSDPTPPKSRRPVDKHTADES